MDFLRRAPPLGPAVRILLLEDDPISVEIVTSLKRFDSLSAFAAENGM